MLIIAVDDEPIMLKYLVACIREAEPNAELHEFIRVSEALAFATENTVDVAFLDIRMRLMTGTELGKQLKLLNPRTNIIFCTGYGDYALEAMQDIRASGYLLKPIRTEDIIYELKHLRVPLLQNSFQKTDVFFRCFGQFELFYKGEPVDFKSSKAKELLALLVDRRGAICTNRQLEVELWEDDLDHRKYLFKLKNELKETFQKLGIDQVLKLSSGGKGVGILMDKVTCDYYSWLKGDPEGVRAFCGEYMEQYSGWATLSRALILRAGDKE